MVLRGGLGSWRNHRLLPRSFPQPLVLLLAVPEGGALWGSRETADAARLPLKKEEKFKDEVNSKSNFSLD